MHWQGVPISMLLTREYANQHPDIYRELFRSMQCWLDKSPTEAHLALAKAGLPIVTENIDRLHQKAGSPKVVELHGNLKDGLVLLDDPVRNWDKAIRIIDGATHLLVVGCSLKVKPAGDIPKLAGEKGLLVDTINEAADERVMQWLKNNKLL